MAEPLLEVSHLAVHYGGIEALCDFSLQLEEGEKVALIGANGAGKSSTLKALAGVVPFAQGSLRYDGMDWTHQPAWKRARAGLILVPEGRGVFPRLSIAENLQMGQMGRSDPAAMEKVYARFPRLYERRTQAAGTLSGGEQQLLALGRALLTRPRLLMLDEPSMGLAPQRVDEVFGVIAEMVQAGTTLLLVEQNARRALELCDRALILESGRVVFSDRAAVCLASPALRAAYLGE
ncbi:ABC transporter ATP-binding protein [Ferrovum myxofaciens]|jgi:branched-chain amino acid transport system ATP-binding protein|uniref:ABC transporter ATP-binding protein n=1 Tax=Ferrovum myxofaciens TaxID=416213 RepID=A0A9E6MUD2_9PROT|nr:ABC transporter ATP-binding protein [Ferrovum myxofaciens]MBW8028912.1 ATP-binding cassette domain-containing protein [Ferrovum sp.]MBU6994561.1 ABC transporter ATP-binding protein [Ferrovum myxofaciens]QKE38426.1 MAG: ABC transporter ATP-binding protein [Ferrovum myxofaciens]QWY73609.1 MAG: ABC transporter ATP-binding protein [Ferrovum myxofaciens]QWY76363.1 MAG: ABC transporter ATP-binding protein [Ferrovum myxofaciens]